jgi:hypothetical protein
VTYWQKTAKAIVATWFVACSSFHLWPIDGGEVDAGTFFGWLLVERFVAWDCLDRPCTY